MIVLLQNLANMPDDDSVFHQNHLDLTGEVTNPSSAAVVADDS